MFQRLFKRPHVIQRQLAAPLLEARQRYLTDCAAQGMAHQTLREIALYQLIAIDYLKLSDEVVVTRDEIKAAAEKWARRPPQTRMLPACCPHAERHCFASFQNAVHQTHHSLA